MRGLAILVLAIWVALVTGCSVFGGGAPTHIVVQWTTGSEINTAGFNLYRGDAAEGPFNKVNAALIPATNDPIAGGKYQYQDNNVKPGQTYYYELEDVELSGNSTRHGPIVIQAPPAAGIDSMIPAVLLAGLGLIIVLGAVAVLRRRGGESRRPAIDSMPEELPRL